MINSEADFPADVKVLLNEIRWCNHQLFVEWKRYPYDFEPGLELDEHIDVLDAELDILLERYDIRCDIPLM